MSLANPSALSSIMHRRCPKSRPCATKYFWTRIPYEEWKSGAATSNEHDRGKPPPRISSNDGIPVDVMTVEGDTGEERVPGYKFTSLADPLRLKEDMDP